MFEISNPRILWLKGGLFLLGGTLAAALIVLRQPTLAIVLLMAITIWCFCRAYYFAFYVLERYVDPAYRFAGLLAFARYALQRQSRTKNSE